MSQVRESNATKPTSSAVFDSFESNFSTVFAEATPPLLADAVVAEKPLEKAEVDKTDLHNAHAATISASNAHKIMGDLSSPALPAAARAYIESMARGGNRSDVSTPAMQWGVDNEPKAITALENHLGEKISFTGENQKRFYYGEFVSALPDGVRCNGDGDMIAAVEVKCLNTDNHVDAYSNVMTGEDLKVEDWAKYCQVQAQMLCMDVQLATFVFYDPRHAIPLHIVTVTADEDWRFIFLNRAIQAKTYFADIKLEDSKKSAFTESSEPAPEIANLPRVQIELSDIATYHQSPEKLVSIIQQQAGSFVFDMSIAKGRDACRSHAANIIRCITPAINASKSIAAEAKKVQEADLYFRKTFEKGVREIADHTRMPLTEWEAEQNRIAAELARQETEAEAERQLALQYSADWDAALVEDELISFRKEKALRDAKAQEELKAKAQADHERQLQERAVEQERERKAAEQREIEAEQKRETARIEQRRVDAEARAEKAELDAIEAIAQAERDKLANEQRAEQAKQAAERDAKEREQLAIDNERKRHEAELKAKAGEQARIDEADRKKAANRKHQAAINGEILIGLVALGASEELAKAVIKAAVKRELGALTINY